MLTFPKFQNLEAVAAVDLNKIHSLFLPRNPGVPVFNYDQEKHMALVRGPAQAKAIEKFKNMEKPWANYKLSTQHTSAECCYLYDMAKTLGPGNYANLGTLMGGSAACLAYGLKANDSIGSIYAIDLWKGEDSSEQMLKSMMKAFVDLNLNDYLIVCKGWTFEYAKKFAQEKKTFKFILIDADHHFVSCLLDFSMWEHLLELGGVITFHDCNMNTVHAVIESKVKLLDRFEEIDSCYRFRSFKKIKC